MDFSDALKEHAKEDARQFAELHAILERIEKKLDPLVEVYDGVLFSKKFIVGLASVVLAIGAVGAGVIWLVNAAINK